MTRSILSIGLALAFTGVLLAQDPPEPAAGSRAPERARDLRTCVNAAVAYLLRTQNEDGSWGGSMKPAIGFDEFWSNPETHRAWTIATTGPKVSS